jgi:hypothetical protein
MSIDDVEQVSHIARLAVLAIFARGVAAVEFENSDDIQQVRLVVTRAVGQEQSSVDLEVLGAASVLLGGVAL